MDTSHPEHSHATMSNPNYLAVIAGFLVSSGTLLFAYHVSHMLNTRTVVDSPVFSGMTLLIGFALGHYLGLALTRDAAPLHYFLVGVYGTLTIVAFAATFYMSILDWSLTAAMLFFTFGVLAMHISGVIEHHEYVELFIRMIAEWLTGGAIGITGLVYYIIPFLLSIFSG